MSASAWLHADVCGEVLDGDDRLAVVDELVERPGNDSRQRDGRLRSEPGPAGMRAAALGGGGCAPPRPRQPTS
ncbi:hypothetical protein ABZ070_31780 [Streptomyces sp. NPDC006283]|uniref:hypothetical protein n=1 Tax=Streptomyces sp. NPDC006283 TaxID=3156741 RepID=UPI0033A2A2A0